MGLVVFAEVADAGSFTAAASRLQMSKASVSKQVRRLEDTLGARLINRTTRRFSLTEVGRAVYDRAAEARAAAAEAEEAVTALNPAPRGVLRVNAPISFGVRFVAPLVPKFMALYPDLRVDMQFADRFVDIVEEGYDVVLRIGTLRDSTLVARRLAAIRRSVCAAPSYWDAHGRPERPEDLRGHRCLRYAYLQTPDAWPFALANGRASVRVDGPLTTNSGDVEYAAALEGLGVAFLPAFFIAGAVAEGRLETVLQDYEMEPLALSAVYPHARHLSAKVRAFVDFLVPRFRDPPWEPEGAFSQAASSSG